MEWELWTSPERTTSTGLITINAGSVVVEPGGTITGDNAVTFGSSGIGSGTLNVNAPSSAGTTNLAALTVSGGGNTVQSTYNTGTDALTFASLAVSNGATVNFVTSGGVNGSTNRINITGQSAAGFINAGAFYDGADFAYMNSAAGYVRAPVYGTDSNFNLVAAGVGALLTGTSNNEITATSGLGVILPSGSSNTAPAGTVFQTVIQSAAQTINSLKLSGNDVALEVNGQVTIQTGANNTRGGIIATGGSISITGPGGLSTGVNGTNSSGDLVIDVPLATDSLTVSTPITGNTQGGLTLTGAGTVYLSNPTNIIGANSGFTGSIYIETPPYRLQALERATRQLWAPPLLAPFT